MSIFLSGLKLGRRSIQNQRSFFLGSSLKIIFHDAHRKRFLFKIEYDKNAEIHYRLRDDVVNVIDLHHTYVPKVYRGKGIAFIMAEEVFEYIAKNNVKVTLTCPFLLEYYKDHPELKDLIYELLEPENQGP